MDHHEIKHGYPAFELVPVCDRHSWALKSLKSFLQSKTSYDVLQVSYRLIVLESGLPVKKALNILLQNKIMSVPLWDSSMSKFDGLLTTSDFIHVVQYYFSYPDKADLVERLVLRDLKDIEHAIGVDPLEMISMTPFVPLYDLCVAMINSRNKKMPLIDREIETGREIVISVLTQYRLLKFLAINTNNEVKLLTKTIGELQIYTKDDLVYCYMNSPMIDVIQLLTTNKISAIPIVDNQGILVNAYEATDILGLIKGGLYNDLSLNVGEALMRRNENYEGVVTCTSSDKLSTIMDMIKRTTVHRFFVVDLQGRLQGVLTLSDILRYIING